MVTCETNSVDLGEVSHDEPPHLDLHRLQINFSFVRPSVVCSVTVIQYTCKIRERCEIVLVHAESKE